MLGSHYALHLLINRLVTELGIIKLKLNIEISVELPTQFNNILRFY
jgi:hypothetical protein